MADNRLKTPKILWGAAFANTLNIGYPVDHFKAGSTPRAGSAFIQTPGGVEDAWTVGTDYTLEGVFRWIPQTSTSSPLATGWDTASTGFRLFLEWARDKNVIRYYPDAATGTYVDSYWVEPMEGAPDPEADGTRTLPFKIRNASTAYDGF